VRERGSHRGDKRPPPEIEWDSDAEVRCVHAQECGACPLMPKRYEEQRVIKERRLAHSLARYGIEPNRTLGNVDSATSITGYRRRAKLVVAHDAAGDVAVGLYRRHDNQHVVDIPHCQVLSPPLIELVAELRELANDPPPELAALVTPSVGGEGVLTGLDVRQLKPPPDDADNGSVLLTLIVAAERAPSVEDMRDAARAMRKRFPQIAGLSVSLRYSTRQQSNSEFVLLSGLDESKDAIGEGYQLVSHTSFLHVHRGQSERLYDMLGTIVDEALAGQEHKRVLDLYGGTGAIALMLAQRGYLATLVESYPPAAALASRAAQQQRLPVEVVTGDVASVTKALAAAGSTFEVVIANPPRRGLSPAARESIAALKPERVVYVACDLDNLSRDLDHLARLGYRPRDLYPLDMLPLTEEIEVVAVLEKGPVPVPSVLYEDDTVVALDKSPHEPVQDQPEYPASLVARARADVDGGEWQTVLKIEAGTSGVTFFAKDAGAAERWAEAIAKTGRLVYLAAARGVTPAKGAITRELRGEDGARPARTRYRRLAIGGGHSVLRVVPEKRYVHQIRRHLAAIGHPVLGDARYGHAPTNRYFEEKHGLDRSFLHLVRVEVDHPDTGNRLLIEAPLPADLRASLVRASDESVLRFLENKRALGSQGVRQRDGGPPSAPMSERSPLSVVEPEPESVYPSHRGQPVSQRGRDGAIDLDEAPRTVRGELLTPDED
jgi:tRNA/tmRNA/rRNA uracil-C5-methylase (TrmA/RlmC/RlmD family)/23S rRNA-/tRNA-specific pseudouridylate synthase